MATDNPDSPPASPVLANAAPLPPMVESVTDASSPKKRRPLWQRIIIYAVLAVVAIVVFLFILGLIVGKPKDTDITSVLRRTTTDLTFGTQAGMTGKFGEAASLVRDPPAGLKATFSWTSRPSGIDAEITTFDTEAHATAAFEQLRDGGSSSLLFPELPDEAVTTEYQGFTQTREDSAITKKFECGQREHEYACGSIVVGVPAIVVLREPMEADWHKPGVDTFNAADPGSDDPEVAMKGMEAMAAKFDKSDKLSKEMREIDKTLQRLGIPVQVLEAKNSPK